MKKQRKACDLKSCFICRYSDSDWLTKIAEERQNLVYQKGEVIFKEGDEALGIYFLLEGCVKIHKHWGVDKELVLHFNREGELFGYRGMGANTFYPVTATALEKSLVCFVDLDFFNHTLRANQELALRFLNFYVEELRYAEERMRNLALMDVKGRIADTILTLDRQFGHTDDGYIAVYLKRQDLAAYAGTTYETFFRMMNELMREGSIVTDGKKISIRDRQLLESHCSINI